MLHLNHISEEELKNVIRNEYFSNYDADKIIGKIDFAVAVPQQQPDLFETQYFLWAEAKRGNKEDVYHSLVQLILTVGKERTFDHHLPPAFLGAFDAEVMAFVPYADVMDIF